MPWQEIWEWVWLLIRVGILYLIARAIQNYFRRVANTLQDIAIELRQRNLIERFKAFHSSDKSE